MMTVFHTQAEEDAFTVMAGKLAEAIKQKNDAEMRASHLEVQKAEAEKSLADAMGKLQEAQEQVKTFHDAEFQDAMRKDLAQEDEENANAAMVAQLEEARSAHRDAQNALQVCMQSSETCHHIIYHSKT